MAGGFTLFIHVGKLSDRFLSFSTRFMFFKQTLVAIVKLSSRCQMI